MPGLLNDIIHSRSPSSVPRVQLPEELFANVGAAVGAQVNRALGFLQDVSCGRDLKQFVIVSDAVECNTLYPTLHACLSLH